MSEQKPPAETTPKASYRGRPGHWKGVITLNGKVIWTCPHSHPNRDQTTSRSRTAAQPCARLMLTLVTDGEQAPNLAWIWKPNSVGVLATSSDRARPLMANWINDLRPFVSELKSKLRLTVTKRLGMVAKEFGCSDCAWHLAKPRRGPFAHATRKAIISQVKLSFKQHRCENYLLTNPTKYGMISQETR